VVWTHGIVPPAVLSFGTAHFPARDESAAARAEDRLVLFGETRFVGNVGELFADAWEWRPSTS
jgi:hypothetical protein